MRFGARTTAAMAMLGIATSASAAPPKDEMAPFEDSALDAVTSDTLTTFESDTDFRRYLGQLARLKKARQSHWAGHAVPHITLAQAVEPPCIPTPTNPCPEADASDSVVVTAAKASAPSITNNQTAGVDEGDIIKQIGPFLLVLQDGRIFSIDTRIAGPRRLALADRINVYRNKNSGNWYDEMLVQGDRIIITAYSYEEDASELSVFRLDPATGKLNADGVFLISSDDYYSAENYATRIVGDRLVIYSPYDVDQFKDRKGRPAIRRWLPEAERKAKQDDAQPLIDARSIYRPIQRTSEPTIHTVTICPLGNRAALAMLACKATAIIGPQNAEMFVSPDDVFLWMSPGWNELNRWRDCATKDRAPASAVRPSAVFRLPVRGGEPGAIRTLGAPFDQFSMDSGEGKFRALVDWADTRCAQSWRDSREVALVSIGLDEFATDIVPVAPGRFRAMPSPGKRIVENRFADDWLVYGGRDNWSGYPPDAEDGVQTARAVAVPLDHPQRAQVFELPNSIVRTERVGNDIILNGYHDGSGLVMRIVKLGKTASLAPPLLLPRRYESEGRSHAFNSIVSADGSGLIGVPTVKGDDEAGRWWWRSESSDLSFVTLAADGNLARAGELVVGTKEPGDDYDCEVSCIDWYGNSRPVFTDGRIFGLMGTEMIEARLSDGAITPLERLDLTKPVAAR